MVIKRDYVGTKNDLFLSDGTLGVQSSDSEHDSWDKTDLHLASIGGLPQSYLYDCDINPATVGATSFELTVEVDGYAPCTITVVDGVCTGPW